MRAIAEPRVGRARLGTVLAGLALASGFSAPHLAASGAERTGENAIVRVAAASSLRESLTRVIAQFQKLKPGMQVRPVFGASSTLARQILAAAPIDLVILADRRSLDLLETDGRLVARTRFDLLTNALVVLVPKGGTIEIGKAEDLASPALGKIALCDDAVPVGHYARRWLASKGLLEAIVPRAVRPDDARAALTMAESGAVGAAFVYRTDARAARRSRVAFEIPATETPGIVYPVALVAGGPNPEGARRFYEFLREPAVGYLFTIEGFGLVEPH